MSASQDTYNKILSILRKALGPLDIQLRDDGAQHAGHHHKGQGGHFTLFLISEAFHGLSRLERERTVIEALRPLFDAKEIHALSMTLRSPEESH
jgi:BolA protein